MLLGKEIFEFQCTFRRSSKARRINIRVTEPRKIILTLPKGVSEETGKEFVKKQGAWIRKNSLLVPRRQTLASYFTKGSEVCIEDVSKKINWSVDPNLKQTKREFNGNFIQYQFPNESTIEQDLLRECIRLGKEYLPLRLSKLERKVKTFSHRCRIGNQKSRWGSCSEKGTISLNWRIILLPNYLGDYIIYHEIAHLVEMNHSVNFWNQLEKFVTGAKQLDKELIRQGKGIITLGHPDIV